jgi:hypothetical protein
MAEEHWIVAQMAQIAAAQAEIASMQAANTARIQAGESLAYGEAEFDRVRVSLLELAQNALKRW